jgi:hypothetical protein
MKQEFHPLLEPHLGWPVVLDSNLLLLHWCTGFDPLLIKTFKRLNEFEAVDLYILDELLKVLGELRTTPHVLTEVSNLANALPAWRKSAWAAYVQGSVPFIPEFHEPAATILSDPLWATFGLTDAALSRLASDHLIVTIDWRLASSLQMRGLAALNFKHLRPGRLEI